MNNTISKPNFLIIGAAKAATTSLSNMLGSHPQAAIVQTKEPHFFLMMKFIIRVGIIINRYMLIVKMSWP